MNRPSMFFCLAMALAASAFSVQAANLKCQGGRLVDVSGEINTQNIFEANIPAPAASVLPVSKVQSGEICLVLQGVQGEVFNKCGGIVGTIRRQVAQTDGSILAYLTHNIVFGPNEGFQTYNDRAVLVPTSEASFDASEWITQIGNGKGLFSNMAANIVAEGSVSFVPNANHFVLSGTACLKKNTDG